MRMNTGRNRLILVLAWSLALAGCGRDEVVAEAMDTANQGPGADQDDVFDFDPDRRTPPPANNGPANNGPANNGQPTDCTPGDSKCDGDIAVVCTTGGVLVETFCQEQGGFCEEGRRGAACRDWACEPGAVQCLGPDTTGVCDERGSGFAFVSPCERGCEPRTGDCREAPASECEDEDSLPVLRVGATRLNLCDATNSQTNVQSEDCSANGRQFPGNDATFRLQLDARSQVTIDLRDADEQAPIDTVLYLQAACGAADSQIACHDDLDCDESDIEQGCEGGRQVRHSRLQLALDPGEYYVVADHYAYDRRGASFVCGNVSLTLSVRELDD
jgi:hypothetical protein